MGCGISKGCQLVDFQLVDLYEFRFALHSIEFANVCQFVRFNVEKNLVVI